MNLSNFKIVLFFVILLNQNSFGQVPSFEWVKKIGGSSSDIGYSITVDSFGNTYITGIFNGTSDFDPSTDLYNLTSSGEGDIFVCKLDVSGNLVWAKHFGGIENDYGKDIKIDFNGNVVVTGVFRNSINFQNKFQVVNLVSNGQEDIFILKLDSLGNMVWVKQFGGTGSDQGNGIKIDLYGDIFVTGAFQNSIQYLLQSNSFELTSSGESDVILIKLENSGNIIWLKKFGSLGNDISNGIDTDKDGYVYLIGNFHGIIYYNIGSQFNNISSLGESDVFIAKLDANGEPIWFSQFGGSSIDIGNSVKVDNNGFIYSTGSFRAVINLISQNLTSLGESDIFILKQDQSGSILWAKQSGGQFNDYGSTIHLNKNGNIFITGLWSGSYSISEDGGGSGTPYSRAFIWILNNLGEYIYGKSFGTFLSSSTGFSLTADKNDNLYLTGRFSRTVNFSPTSQIRNISSTNLSIDIFVLKWNNSNNCVPIIFDQNIQNISTIVGSTATFYVSANGTPPFTYQWIKNGAVISGATSQTYITPIVSILDNGNEYSCIITNCSGLNSDTSNVATLTVTDECLLPTEQSSYINFTNIQPNSITLQWIKGDGSNRIVVVKEGTPIIGRPIDGNSYIASTSFGGGSTISPNEFVVYNGPGSSVPVSNLNANTIYHFKVFEYNCNPAQYVTSIGANNPRSVSTSINHPTINSLICTNRIPNKNDYTFYSKDFPPSSNNLPIKVCADGSSASFFKVNVSNPSGIGFRILDGTTEVVKGTNSDDVSKYGKFGQQVIFNENFVEVNYTHPDHLSSGLFLNLTLQITYNEIPLTTFPLHIYRAPIVFVHGFIGESSTFVDMENKFLNDNLYPFLPFSPLIHRVNYFNESLQKFQSNRKVVPKGIDDVFTKVRTQSFSAGKVIVIAHSMGGILSRLYLQSQYGVTYRNDIAKLITLNTPHHGTQFANWGGDNLFFLNSLLAIWFTINDIPFLNVSPSILSNGAILDMQVNSPDMLNHLNIHQNLQNKVPSATLSTISDGSLKVEILSRLFFNPSDIYNSEMNDLVVPLSSQMSGISTHIPTPFQFHIGSSENESLIQHVSNLIKLKPSSNLFTKTGFPQGYLDPPSYRRKNPDPTLIRSQFADSLIIITPIDSQYFSANQYVNIDIFSQGDISRMALIVYGASIDPIVFDTIAVDKLIFQIPDQAVGKLNLLLLGGNENEWLKSESISIFVSTNHPLDSLVATPDTINLPLGTFATIDSRGYFNSSLDGINLSGVPDLIIQYNSNYLDKVNESTFYGKQVGSTYVLFTYKGKTASVYINIFDDPTVLTASFNYSQDNICTNSYVSFGDESKGFAIGYLWTFPGGIPSTSTEKNPKVFYAQPGNFPVKIKTYFANGVDSFELENLIKVGGSGEGLNCSCTTPDTPANISASVSDENITLLTWSPGDPAGSPNIRYNWMVSIDSTTEYGNGISHGTTTNTGVSTNLIPPGGTYYLRVNAQTNCDDSSSEFGTSAAFHTVPCTTPGLPVNAQALATSNTTANISWLVGNPKGAPTVLYYWVIGTSPTVIYGHGVDQGITILTQDISTDLSPGTTYFLRVYAVSDCNNIQTQYTTSLPFTTTGGVACITPGVPFEVQALSVGKHEANITWNAGFPAGSPEISYFWVIGTNPDVTYGNGVDQGFTSGTSAVTSLLACNTNYYVRVFAKTSCNNAISGYRTAQVFNTSPCSCITPGSPKDTKVLQTGQNSVNLSWSSGTPLGSPNVSYFWVVGTNPSVLHGGGVAQGTTNSTLIPVTGLIQGQTYYFRVYAKTSCNNTASIYATSQSFQLQNPCTTPSYQSTTITFSLVSTQQFTANWTNGNGSRRIVKINTINSFTPPTNGTDPSANLKYSGSGEQVVYNGNGSSVTITGLRPNQKYWLRVYEANCDGINSVYNKTSATNNPNSQSTRTVLPSVQSFTASNVIFEGNNIIDISPIFTTNKPYDTHPPIDIYIEDNNKTRFALNASYAVGFSFQLVDQLTIVTDGTMAINPSVYGSLEPVTQTSNSSMYMDYIHPAAVSEEPYLDLKLKLLFEGGLVGMSIPIHIHPSQSPLPVEMSDIRVKHNKLNDINELTWTTKSEVNNDYFDIERSFEREAFKNIGKVDGIGSSSSSLDYIFNDRNIPYDGTYIYRLKQVDMDGKATTSKLVSVTVSRAPSVKTGLFPNPSTDIINCYVDAYVGAEVNIEVFNNLGQLVSQQSILDKLSEARMTKQLEGKAFGKGIFTVVFTVDGIRYNHKLIMIE